MAAFPRQALQWVKAAALAEAERAEAERVADERAAAEQAAAATAAPIVARMTLTADADFDFGKSILRPAGPCTSRARILNSRAATASMG